MPRMPDPRVEQAEELFRQGKKLIDIAESFGRSGRNDPQLEKQMWLGSRRKCNVAKEKTQRCKKERWSAGE